jgi:FlaG protein
MSTDFNIKPVGAPVAAPIVQPIREAAKQAVKTELPASSTVTAADAGSAVRYDSNVVSRSMSNQVVIDRDAAAIVYQVVDNRTSEVIKQFPEEAVLRRRAYFRTLELAKDAPTRLRATDRKA